MLIGLPNKLLKLFNGDLTKKVEVEVKKSKILFLTTSKEELLDNLSLKFLVNNQMSLHMIKP
jgi:hypothetical protein